MEFPGTCIFCIVTFLNLHILCQQSPHATMRGQSPLIRATRTARLIPIRQQLHPARPSFVCWQCRSIQISAAPTNRPGPDAFDAGRNVEDAQFEVLGAPSSLLSVSLSASQRLYTRRGTLVSVAGKVENVRTLDFSPLHAPPWPSSTPT